MINRFSSRRSVFTIMTKSLVILVFLFLNILKFTCVRSPDRIDGKAKTEYPLMNCSSSNVEIKLSEFSNVQRSDGVLLARLPQKTIYFHICYPLDHNENKLAALLSHVVCRQRGFMSYSSMYRQAIPSNTAREMSSIIPSSAHCQGLEQTVSQCSWRSIEYETCRVVMGVQCGTCNSVVEAQSGVLHNPGFPYTYLYAVTCEWHIVAPENHIISFLFKKMSLPLASKTSKTCDGTEPFVEIVYGIYDGYMVRKYCRHNLVNNLTIPFARARVRFFSGLYFEGLEDGTEKYEFSLAFQAVPEELTVSQPLKIIIGIPVGMVFFAVIVISCYCCRKWEQRGQAQNSEEQLPNAPTREEIEFPRCQMRPRHEVEDANANLPMQDTSRMSISKSCRFHSRSTDVRHRDFIEYRQHPNYSEHRKPKDPSTTTPRCALSQDFDNEDCKISRLSNFKTKLISRFTSSIAISNSSVSIIQVIEPSFAIYHSTSSSMEEDIDSVFELSIPTPPVTKRKSFANERESKQHTPSLILPTIVIDFYEDDVFSKNQIHQ